MEGHKIIKAMRIYLGMSQREAAEKLGIYLSVYQKYENIPGFVMRANFTRVCKILEFMHLDPNKFFMERYELTEAGYEVTARETTGTPTNQQKRILRECCPVRYIRCRNRITEVTILSSDLK